MNFITYTRNNAVTKTRILNAGSWSSCLAYLEGTGESIRQIVLIPDTTTIVINKPDTTYCYDIVLKDSEDNRTTYSVFENNYNDLQTWISQQTGKSVSFMEFTQKTYVVV